MGAFTPIKIVVHLLFLAFICYGGWLTYSYRFAPEQEPGIASAEASVARQSKTMSDPSVSDEDRERMKALVEDAFEESMNPAVSYDHRRDLSEATDEDYSDFGEPTMTTE